MNDTSSHLPVCIYCGTSRPADETLCPKCGKPWIDTSISDTSLPPSSVAATTSLQPSSATPPPPPSAIEDTGEFDFDAWTLPPEPKRSKAKWLIPAILLVAVAATAAVIYLDRVDTPTDVPVAAPETTTTLGATTTVATTTVAPTTAAPTTTTTTTTTTLPFPSADTWVTAGDPIPTPQLGLRASGIGPISVGTPLVEVAGTLIASLGEPDLAGFDADLCPSPEWYWLEWGDLRVIFDGYNDDAQFIAYRYGDRVGGSTGAALETLSGIGLGDTVETLTRTYENFTITFETIDGREYFLLEGSTELLLWGPVTSREPSGLIEGIFSPSPCDT